MKKILSAVLLFVAALFLLTNFENGNTFPPSTAQSVTAEEVVAKKTVAENNPLLKTVNQAETKAKTMIKSEWTSYEQNKVKVQKTATDLQNEINRSEKVVLEGTYQFNGERVVIPSNRKIDATNAVIVGEGHLVTSFANNIKWHGGTVNYEDRGVNEGFSFQLWRSTNMTFENMTFNHNNLGQHHFDIMGSSFVNINNSSFNGYNPRANSTETTNKPHDSYAESIQIDYAYAGGIGGAESQNFIESISNGQYSPTDDTPTHDVNIFNNTFTDLPGEMTQYPVGEHVKPRSQGSIYNIHIKNAKFNSGNVVPPAIMATNGEWSRPWFFRTDNAANNIVID